MIRTILFFALFCLLSMGLAAIQLFTTAELSAESVRTKMTWENSTVGSLSPSNLLTFLAPKFYGWITGIMEMDRASGTFTNGSPFWGGEGGHLFWETTLFIGITPLLLMITAFSGLRKNKLFLLWMGLGLFFLLAAFGKNGPVYPLLFKLPGFNLFRHPGRFAFIFSFSFILAAALSLDYLAGLIRNPNPALLSTTKRALYIGSGILGLLLLLSLTTLSGLDAAKAEAARQAVLWGLFAIIIIALLIGLLLKTGRPSAAYGLIAFTFLELFLFGYRFGCGKQTGQEAYPSDTRLDAIRAEIAQNPYRLQGRIFEGPGKGVRLFPHLNMGMVYEIPLVEGYNQLHLQRLSRFVHEVDPQKEMALLNVRYRAHPSGQGFIVALPDSFCARFSLRSTLITADSGGEAIQFINSPSFDPLRQAIIESKPSLVFDSSLLPEQLGTVRIRTYSANEITLFVQAAANALLFASEVWYPAWHAEVDGKKVPILRTNYLFRGVELTKGEHQVRFYYHSDAMRKGMWVTLISLLLVAGLWVGFSGFHNIATQK
ncbi:MAG: hypothetical protein A2293_07860 [Elusimicrobia bacterium RIFOXYB2_FULL_49_7]|nr:MAG: hypothetical protein A2293_07860 [Elusimicrobia bacterium RIFOXYB2_FULL_49_7]